MATFDQISQTPKYRKRLALRNNSWSHPTTALDINKREKKFLGKVNNYNFDVLNVNSLTSTSKDRHRKSFHQDVEEALSSLLWQPYEYQLQQSSSSSSSCSDLDENNTNKGSLPHSSSYCVDRRNLSEDFKPATSSSDQCATAIPSRDTLSSCPVADVGASRLNEKEANNSLLELCEGTGCHSLCDVYSDMQVEPPNDTNTTPLNISNVATPNNGLNQNHDNGASWLLSSANVVGLPENPRRAASVPVRNPPNHPRNVSEPSTELFRVQRTNPNLSVTHLRSASVPKTLPTSHENPNVSNINVNFYRAVPVNVVSSVPTIQCLNTLSNDNENENEGNSISNVQIMPLGGGSNNGVVGTTQVTVHNTPTQQINVVQNNNNRNLTPRTFTSTEAQTDEISVCPSNQVVPTREQRRKERRERRHQRRMNNHRHTVEETNQNDCLPDLLNSHMPPPYSPLNNVMVPNPVMVPQSVLQTVVSSVPNGLMTFPPPPPPPVSLVQAGGSPVAVTVQPPSGFRFPFPAGAALRR